MKKYIYLIISIFAITGCKKTDKREYFVKPIEVVCDYPFNDTTKWAITCRVWGLLKYYHPNVAAGKLDWDKVFLDRSQKINNAKTPEEVNSVLMDIIRTAGSYKGTVDKSWNDSLNMNVNLCWLDNSFINDSIRLELRKITSLIGTPTAGADASISYLPMPGDITAYVSSIGSFHPPFGYVQRKGVIPDIEVYPTMESILEGKDEILEEAIRYLNNLK